MQVNAFDINKGWYVFQLSHLDTVMHTHPAMELILAQKGSFTLHSRGEHLEGLTLAVLDKNEPHQLSSEPGSSLQIIMLEQPISRVKLFLETLGIELDSGIFWQKTALSGDQLKLKDSLFALLNNSQWEEYEPRTQQIMHLIHHQHTDWTAFTQQLQVTLKLSESRISHIFRQTVGVSLRHYWGWYMLKTAIHLHLAGQQDMLSALLSAGFYDQAHFSNSFKKMLGVKPSFAYNSRILQVS